MILGFSKPLFAGAGAGVDGNVKDRAKKRRKIIFRFLFKKEKNPDSF